MSAVILGAGLVVTACSPVKLGSAAIVGNERITIATLDTEVTNLSQTVKLYPGTVQLSQAQQTQQTLTWLIRFKINDELARQAGITVSTAEAQKALDEIYSAAKASAQAQGITNVTLDLILVANGIPPNLANEVGRYQAIDNKFAEQVNGGQEPTSTSAQSATTAKLNKARCRGGQGPEGPGQPPVRPAGLQPGRGRRRARDSVTAGWPGQGAFDVGADAGLLIVLVTSPRVAPGLLSWPAWEALRSACRRARPGRTPAAARTGRGRDRLPVAASPIPGRSPATAPWCGCPSPATIRWSRRALSCCAARPTCRARTCSTWWRPWTGCAWNAPGMPGRPTSRWPRTCWRSPTRRSRPSSPAMSRPSARNSVTCCCRWCSTRASRPSAPDGYTIDDVADGIVAKLVRRHPHVFADVTVSGADEVYRNWDEIKKAEKEEKRIGPDGPG